MMAPYGGSRRVVALPGGLQRLFRPGEAGQAIGVRPSTLRMYAQRFSDILSQEAAGEERPGYRLFTERDVAVLRRARELLERGFTYERAAAELRAAGLVARQNETEQARQKPETRRSGGETSLHITALQQALEAWRALAQERGVENAALRDELRDLRLLLLEVSGGQSQRRSRRRA